MWPTWRHPSHQLAEYAQGLQDLNSQPLRISSGGYKGRRHALDIIETLHDVPSLVKILLPLDQALIPCLAAGPLAVLEALPSGR